MDVVERGELLRESNQGAAMAVALPIEHPLDHRLDAPLHRNENAGDQKSRGEGEEVALHRRRFFDEAREQEVDRGEGDQAEDQRHRVRQCLLDHYLDVPQLVFEDGDGERERDERQRNDSDGGVERRHVSGRDVRHDVDRDEREEPQDDPEEDPLDLRLADRRGAAEGVAERHHRRGEVETEVDQLPSLDDVERAIRRRDRNAVRECEEIDVPQRQQHRRRIEQCDGTLVRKDRLREEEEEVQRQRREDDRRDLLEDLQHFVDRVDVARGGVDVDDER